jgi:hypothetical protein
MALYVYVVLRNKQRHSLVSRERFARTTMSKRKPRQRDDDSGLCENARTCFQPRTATATHQWQWCYVHECICFQPRTTTSTFHLHWCDVHETVFQQGDVCPECDKEREPHICVPTTNTEPAVIHDNDDDVDEPLPFAHCPVPAIVEREEERSQCSWMDPYVTTEPGCKV